MEILNVLRDELLKLMPTEAEPEVPAHLRNRATRRAMGFNAHHPQFRAMKRAVRARA